MHYYARKKVNMSKKQEKYIWSVSAESESGDDYGTFLFDKKPTDKQLEEFFRKQCSQEFNSDDPNDDIEGPGNWNSYLHVSLPKKLKIIPI